MTDFFGFDTHCMFTRISGEFSSHSIGDHYLTHPRLKVVKTVGDLGDLIAPCGPWDLEPLATLH